VLWQDWVMAVGSAFFGLALVPTLRDVTSAVPRWTSIPTAAILVAFAYTQWTLELRVAPALELIGAVGWALIALRRASPTRVTKP
jgi:hypothetical protein